MMDIEGGWLDSNNDEGEMGREEEVVQLIKWRQRGRLRLLRNTESWYETT
jgi:hypothetical protein